MLLCSHKILDGATNSLYITIDFNYMNGPWDLDQFIQVEFISKLVWVHGANNLTGEGSLNNGFFDNLARVFK